MAYLRSFQDFELIFDEEETRQILKFFFPRHKDYIDKLRINNRIRNYAQGILVEAVDASYAMGYIDAVFQTIRAFFASGKLGYANFMKTLANKAMRHWFKHAAKIDLMHAQIYETVRVQIERDCYSDFYAIAEDLVKAKGRSVRVASAPHAYYRDGYEISWG